MSELTEVVAAFEQLCAQGRRAALATVVATSGSVYRKPGARMLVADDGRTWGGVSGGCLDRDVALRGHGVLAGEGAQRCRYDTSDAEEDGFAGSTGCGGVVEVFIQPVSAAAPGALVAMRRAVRERRPETVATVLGASAGLGVLPGETWLGQAPAMLGGGVPAGLHPDAAGTPSVQWLRAGDAAVEVFVERLVPPQALVVFGSGPDAVPLVSIAKTLGWHVTVVGARPETALRERFAAADVLRVGSLEDPTAGLEPDADAAVVVMTHNLQRDQAVLARLRGPVRYLGLLGPRHRTERVLAGLPPGTVPSPLHAPVGLELGGRNPGDVALCIAAEIQAVLHRASARPHRELPGPVHRNEPEVPTAVGPRGVAGSARGAGCAP